MILFRADGNEMIASGHIMRCLSIAQAAEAVGEECCFVMADRSFSVVVENAGIKVFYLDTDFKHMQEELKAFIHVLEKTRPRCVVVDSYYVTKKYLEEIRKYSTIVYIDDLGSFAYPVDILVNYNIYGEKINYTQMYHAQNKSEPKLLLGPGYAPLRKEFKNQGKKQQPKQVKDILVSTGGSDYEHVALKLAQYLVAHRDSNNYKYHFLLGALNPDISKLTKLAESFPSLIELHQNVKHVEQLMQKCDIAVSAAGSTLYELCACGIPTITYVLADNQILGARTFFEKGLMLYVGDCRSDKSFTECVVQTVGELAKDYLLRERIAGQLHALVTGNGAEKLVKDLISLANAFQKA